jgi:HSP20 family protein
MPPNDPRAWMWSEALQALAQADRLHRQIFRPGTEPQRRPSWEPPVDMLETADKLLVLAALPGVDPAQVTAAIQDDGVLVISGSRVLPEELRTAVIHRLELPQGFFERRVALPPGRYENVRSAAVNGCLVISLTKAGRGGQP